MNITRNLALIAVMGASTVAPLTLAEESSRSMEEVVVTSRRKDESVQDVPLSVTAFGEEAIEQIKPNTLRDFDGLVPNVYIGMNTAGPGASALYIRGVGYADIEKTQSPQVGVIVDGIQMGSSTGQLIDVFDVESIEINRGPQGVLFGKNTIGGNIVVNRVKPQFNDFGVKASAEMGNYNGKTMKARVNIPLIDDTLAFKFGAISRERDGFYDNVNLNRTAGDIDFSSQTAALAWAPSDSVEINLTYDHIGDRSQTMPQDPRFDGDNRFVNRADKIEPTSYEVDQIGLKIDWDISDTMTLHYVGGSANGRDVVNQDFDGGDINGAAIPFAQLHTLRDQKYDIQSQELRLDIDVNEQVSAMVGYYDFASDLAFRQDTNNILQLPNVAIFGANVPCAAAGFRSNATPGLETFCQFPNARSTQLAGETVDSKAWFGSISYRATDDFEVTLGARSIDESKSAYNSYTDFSFNPADGRVANPVYDDVSAAGYNEHDFRGLASIPGA
ncbi:TonB-dependent receptor, partial [Pseudomonadales bacterium]|nr:TonB-dependent receptor [Pseudomonadales bacterium]